jgi:hypothetical protein
MGAGIGGAWNGGGWLGKLGMDGLLKLRGGEGLMLKACNTAQSVHALPAQPPAAGVRRETARVCTEAPCLHRSAGTPDPLAGRVPT